MKNTILSIFFLILIFCNSGFAQSDWMNTGSVYTSTVHKPYSKRVSQKWESPFHHELRNGHSLVSPEKISYYTVPPIEFSSMPTYFSPSTMYSEKIAIAPPFSLQKMSNNFTFADDEWTPEEWDGPTIIDPGEPMPIGENLLLLLFAIIYIIIKMRKQTLTKASIFLLLLCVSPMNATNYFFANEIHGTGDGTSWDNAKSTGGLRDALASASSGDVFYLAAENFYSGIKTGDNDVLWVIPEGVTLRGGYDLSKYHGTNTDINYDTIRAYTVFSGNQYKGKRPQIYIGPDPDHPTTTDNTDYYSSFSTVKIYGISFQDAPGWADGDYIGNGLFVRHAKVDFFHCQFKDNIDNDRNNAALVAWGSQIRCYDCIFRNNKSKASGSAFCIRARNSKISATEEDYSIAVFERCEFADNICTIGGTDGAYGGCGAIADNGGALYIINSTISGSYGTYGGAIRISINCKGYFISNTFTNNYHTSTNIYGENISAGGGSSCFLLNNIITQYHGTDYYTVKLDGNKTSQGFNYIGHTDLPANSANNDKINNATYTHTAIFGTNTNTNTWQNLGGTSRTIAPKMDVQTTSVSTLIQLANAWNMPIVVTENMRLDLDQRGYPRGASTNGVTSAGAYDPSGNARFYSSGPGSGKKNGFSWDDAKPGNDLAYDLHYPGVINTFYLTAGSYLPNKTNGRTDDTYWRISEGVTVRGGYPVEMTGLTTDINYPTTEQSVFAAPNNASYPFVRIGKTANITDPDSYYAKDASPVQFYGITFSGAQAVEARYTGIMLFVKHTKADFNYCVFKDNIGTGNRSAGAAIQSWGSQVRCLDCIFRNNRASSGAVIMQRARNSDIKLSDDGEGLSIFERCEFSANTSTGAYGGAFSICDNAGTLVMLNCTMSGTTQSSGGAIRISNNCHFYAASCTFINNYNTDSDAQAQGETLSFSSDTNSCTLINSIIVNASDRFDTNRPIVQWGSKTSLTDGGYNTLGTIRRLGSQVLDLTTEYATSVDNVHLFTTPSVFGHNKPTNHGGFSSTITPVQQWQNVISRDNLEAKVNEWNIPLLSNTTVSATFAPTVDQRNENRIQANTQRGAVEHGATNGHIFVRVTGTGKQDGSTWENAIGAQLLASSLQNAGYGVTFHLERGLYTTDGQGYTIPEGVTVMGGYPITMTGTDTRIDYPALDTSMLSILDAQQKNTDRPYIRIGVGSSTASPDNNLSKDFEPCTIWGCEIRNADRTIGGSYNGNMIFVKHAQLNMRYCYLHHSYCSQNPHTQLYSKSSAIVAWGSQVKCYDCVFKDNQGAGSGSAAILRQHNSETGEMYHKDKLSSGLFMRCLFDNNNAITDSAYGGSVALSDYAGTIVIANSTFKGGYCSSNGGALRISTADTLYAISNTFYGASTKDGQGEAISLGHLSIGYILNNIILAPNSTESHPVINIQQYSTTLRSYGYNLLGYVRNNEGTYTPHDSDQTNKTQTQIFSFDDAQLTHIGKPWNSHDALVPTPQLAATTPLSYIYQVIQTWEKRISDDIYQDLLDNIDLDQSALTRPQATIPGAIDLISGRTYRIVCRRDDECEYASNPVRVDGDTLSLYYHTQGSLYCQYRDGIWIDTLTLSAPSLGFTQGDNVYTAVFTKQTNQFGVVGSETTLYEGNYYIRTKAIPNSLNTYLADSMQMVDFDPSISVGYDADNPASYYNHYWLHFMPIGTNVTSCVANRFNPQLLSSWLKADVFTNQSCELLEDAHVRMGYNNFTNLLTRTEMADITRPNYLTIYGDQLYYDGNGTEATTSDHQATFQYNDYGVYQCDLFATNGASVIVKQQYVTNQNYLFGLDGNTPKSHIVVIGKDNEIYALRFIYDYKTNSFSEGWLPEGTLNTDLALNADLFAIRKNNNAASQLLLGNTTVISNIKKAYFVLEIDETSCTTNGPIYWFSLPFDCDISQIKGPGSYGSAWVVQYYNGEKRAANGWLNESQTFWAYKAPTAKLKANEGYALVLNPAKIMWGEALEDGKKVKVTRIFFPTDGTQTFSLKQLVDETTDVSSWPCSIKSREIADANWNILGIPSFNDLTVKRYAWPDQTIPNYIYEWSWNNGNQRYDVVNVTKQQLEGFTFKAFHAYMTQYGGQITWADHAGLREDISAISARNTATASEQIQLNLLSDDTTCLDKTFIGLTAAASLGYDENIDLCKIKNTSLPQIYSFSNDVEWAANCLPYQPTSLPIHLNITHFGNYTLSIERATNHYIPILEDRQTGLRTNLNLNPYQVSLDAGNYVNRFFLNLSQEQDMTQLPSLTTDEDIRIYDMLGRQLFRGNPRSIPQLPGGIYILKQNSNINVAPKFDGLGLSNTYL